MREETAEHREHSLRTEGSPSGDQHVPLTSPRTEVKAEVRENLRVGGGQNLNSCGIFESIGLRAGLSSRHVEGTVCGTVRAVPKLPPIQSSEQVGGGVTAQRALAGTQAAQARELATKRVLDPSYHFFLV